MLEFLFPASMVAGVALISSPIIIHLINRMRFKRIRWAAMEFLLKSQKRNRRKLIIEQLLLLAMRCFLVFLAGLIVARFAGFAFSFFQPGNRQHVVILDDSMSMGDQWLEEGETKTSFKAAKKVIADEIGKNAAMASKAQTMKLMVASRPDEIIFNQRLNDSAVRELNNKLNTLKKETATHADLFTSVEKAGKVLQDTPQDQRILYLVSDFRQLDWSGPNGDRLLKKLKELTDAGVHVKFVDVAHPARKELEKGASYHPNLAIVSLQPESRIVGRNMPATQFKVAVANYGPSDAKNVQVKVKLNGQERAGSSVPFSVIPAGTQVENSFSLYLDEPDINQISAYIDPEETGLNIDNVRYAAVDVRDTVPILAIDGEPGVGRKPGGDTYFLRELFEKSRGLVSGYELVAGTVADLEKPDLHKYPSIYLLNVQDLPDKALQNLEAYVNEGGSVAFFLGPRVNPKFYNTKLYADGNGLFPAPLDERGFSREPTKEDLKERQEYRLTPDAPPYLILRENDHPIFADINGPQYASIMFRYGLDIDQHFPVMRTRWNYQPGRVKELASLHNSRSADDYKASIQSLLDRLAVEEPKYPDYTARLAFYRSGIRDALATKQPLYRVAAWLDGLLSDRGDPEKRKEFPNLGQFWEQPDSEIQALKREFERMVNTTKYGDPLLIEGRYGRGRVLVCTTTLGRRWNNFGSQDKFFPSLHIPLQRYLTSSTAEAELLVGQPLDITLDASRYDTRIQRWFKPEKAPNEVGNQPAAKGGLYDLGPQQTGPPVQGRINFKFADATQPGVYILDFFPRSDAGVEGKPERRAYAFNVDTNTESNLMRVGKEQIQDAVPGSEFYTLGSSDFGKLRDKQSDLSESPWLYLLFLLVLIAEQALAVHLSFHLRGGAASAPVAPSRVAPAPV